MLAAGQGTFASCELTIADSAVYVRLREMRLKMARLASQVATGDGLAPCDIRPAPNCRENLVSQPEDAGK
jgi:hypothetical protein